MRASWVLGGTTVCLLAMIACSSKGGDDSTSNDPAGGASSSSSSSGGGDGTSSSSSSSSSGGASSSSSSSSSSGGMPTGTDQGLIPTDSSWRKNTEWYRTIADAPVAGDSAAMIAALAKWGTTGIFQIDFSFNVLDGAGATKVKIPAQDEADDDPVPIPAKGYIEGDFAYGACDATVDDCHLIVLDKPNNLLYEVYQADKSGNAWSGFLATWKTNAAYPRTNRGLGCSSADAAGLPITPGLIGFKETKAGAINHALRFIMRNEYIRGTVGNRNVPNVVYPASHGTTAGAQARGIPYGGRLRLKQTIKDDDPRIKTPGAKALVKALHTYGMILADGGNIPLVAESAKVYNDADKTSTWDGLLGPRDLGFILPSDFEVIGVPKDNPTKPEAGWYVTRAEYEAQLQKPLGCAGVVQP